MAERISKNDLVYVASPPVDLSGAETKYALFFASDADFVILSAKGYWLERKLGTGQVDPILIFGTHTNENKFGAHKIRFGSVSGTFTLNVEAIKQVIKEDEVFIMTKPESPQGERYGVVQLFFMFRRVS